MAIIKLIENPISAPIKPPMGNPTIPPKKHRYMLLTFSSSAAIKIIKLYGMLMKSPFNVTMSNASSFVSSKLGQVTPNSLTPLGIVRIKKR